MKQVYTLTEYECDQVLVFGGVKRVASFVTGKASSHGLGSTDHLTLNVFTTDALPFNDVPFKDLEAHCRDMAKGQTHLIQVIDGYNNIFEIRKKNLL